MFKNIFTTQKSKMKKVTLVFLTILAFIALTLFALHFISRTLVPPDPGVRPAVRPADAVILPSDPSDEITIKTSKTEYLQGETIEYFIDSNSQTYQIWGFFWENGITPAIKTDDGWKKLKISKQAVVECGSSQVCEDYLARLAEGAPTLRDQNGGRFEWNQKHFLTKSPDCQWKNIFNMLDPEKNNPVCYEELNALPGTYKLFLNATEYFAESNEFIIKKS